MSLWRGSPSLPDLDNRIATVVSMAAHVELGVEHVVVAGLWRQPQLASFIVRNLATEKLVGAAKEILLEELPHEAVNVEAAFKALGSARAQRNILLHRVWRPEPDGKSLRMAARPGRSEEELVRTSSEFASLSNQLAEVSLWLSVFFHKLNQKKRADPGFQMLENSGQGRSPLAPQDGSGV